ncbi:MAG TPA: response regulator transcription factor [Chloroflexota bacterium]|jgi:two-component system response regulator RegX3|nr:response regulator transcription factor [Chloroflexota bacterium]
MARVLVVDDDEHLVDMLAYALRRAGHEVISAGSSAQALACIRDAVPDAAVLDVNLGGENGFDLLRSLRRTSQVPVIMLTAVDEELDKVRGLELGADDYVTKPFSYRELIARIGAVLRRRQGAAPAVGPGGAGSGAPDGAELRAGPLTLNPQTHVATQDGTPLDLTATEFRLLECLMRRPGAVVPSRTILKEVWDYDDPRDRDLIRATLYRLRRKVESDPSQPALIQSIPGVGLKLDV